jgi:hypothetical protein
MLDRPDAAALLHAMAETLSQEILPATRGGAQHSVRVLANLCRILEREVRAGPGPAEQTRKELAGLLGRVPGRRGEREGEEGEPEGLEALVRELDRRLATAPVADRELETRAHAVILEEIRRRLAIDRPGYGYDEGPDE